jgi:aspartate-semialdehyde dehydrogenase
MAVVASHTRAVLSFEAVTMREPSGLNCALVFWVAGDQLLKGAALNVVQTAELL